MENQNEELQNVLGSLNDLLANTKLDDVTAESTGFEALPDGYYLSEVEDAKLTVSKNTHNPMAAFTFKVYNDGYTAELTEDGDVNLNEIPHTKNRKIFVYFSLKDEASVKRFVNNMLKFEGEEPGVPLLGKEYFTNSELLTDALDVLKGMMIYIQVNTNEKEDGSKTTWSNLISWKRAVALGLPA